jgi:hypothetical protein
MLDTAPNTNWNGVAISADGNLAVAPVYQGGIWVSRLVPIIWTHPSDLYVNEGEIVQFLVEAESSIGPEYQWIFENTPIPGETNATLVLTNVQPANAGAYAVVVSNMLGSVTSSNAMLRVNQYPIAHASASPNPAISGNGTTAMVVLDGSGSVDPDGDALTHTWYLFPQSGPSTNAVAVATGPVAATSLPVGMNVVSLVVDDGMARDTDSVTVEVITTAEAVGRLISLVNGSEVPHPQPFLATLEAALASIQRGNCHSAEGQLGAFQNKVRAQVTNLVLANELIEGAGQVIAALDCDGSPNVAARIHSLKRQPNGKMQMKLSGQAGKAHIVEASTNLMDWEAVGVATVNEDGSFEFEDAEAAKHQCRFYRIRQP